MKSIESESEYQEWLASGMKRAGWTVKREVSPDTSNCRVDILAFREDIGTVGIESKMVTNSGAKETGEALSQLLSQYVGRTYGTRTVDAWALALYGDGFSTTDKSSSHSGTARTQAACQRIAIQLGIGYVLNHRGMVLADFSISEPELRLPLFHAHDGRMGDGNYIRCDMDRIRRMTRNRLPR